MYLTTTDIEPYKGSHARPSTNVAKTTPKDPPVLDISSSANESSKLSATPDNKPFSWFEVIVLFLLFLAVMFCLLLVVRAIRKHFNFKY